MFPVIDYGDVCYLNVNAALLNKLDRLFKNCIRFIFNLRKFDRVSTYRTKPPWFNVRQRHSLRALTTLHSLLNSNSLTYLTSHFQYFCSKHDRNLRSSYIPSFFILHIVSVSFILPLPSKL